MDKDTLERRYNEEFVRPLLDQRGQSYGDFTLMSKVAQDIKEAMAYGPADLSSAPRESLQLIATKIARIVCGDPSNRDSWQDIIGYAQLVLDRIAREPYRVPQNGA